MSNFLNLNFQNSNSMVIDLIIIFHDYLIIILILITAVVGYFLYVTIGNSFTTSHLKEQQQLEILWTIVPSLILLGILFPSIKILYLIEESSPSLSFKATGHQWFWSYEYFDLKNKEFDAFIIKIPNTFRLLDVDRRIVIPYSVSTRILTTSTDVIHSWTIPRLLVKSDAVPGRINQINFLISRPGLYYGQCSEICGANHSFIPIILESVKNGNFISFLKTLLSSLNKSSSLLS